MFGELIDVSGVFVAPDYKRATVKAIQITEEGNIDVPYYEGGELKGFIVKSVVPGFWVLLYSSGYVRIMKDDEFRREFEPI
jgi:hypothetical protein